MLTDAERKALLQGVFGGNRPRLDWPEVRKIGNLIDLTGHRYGKLTVASLAGRDGKRQALWLCCCECGAEKVVSSENLSRGKARSCGCSTNEFRSEALRQHGHTPKGNRSGTYTSWHAAINRCTRPSFKQFADYGGRGIKVCERWRVFANFLEDMGERPEGKTLDRIDPDGNYEPGNCKWSSPSEQTLNRRPIIRNGDVRNLIAAAREAVSASEDDLEQALFVLRCELSTFDGGCQ